MTATPASAAINSARLNDNLNTLGEIGRDEFGMQRVAFSRQDVAGRDYVSDLMRGAGMSVRIDPAGNIIGRTEGADPTLPAIVLGSHTDTVPSGGAYDGALGVIGAIDGSGGVAGRRAYAAPSHRGDGVHQRGGHQLPPLASGQPRRGRTVGAGGLCRRRRRRE